MVAATQIERWVRAARAGGGIRGVLRGGRRRVLGAIELGDRLLGIDGQKARVGTHETPGVHGRSDGIPMLVLDRGEVDGADANLFGHLGERKASCLACLTKAFAQIS